MAKIVTDHERVLARLKHRLSQKDSWGRRELLTMIAELEGEELLPEGLPEKALRLHGVALSRELSISPVDTGPAGPVAVGAGTNGHQSSTSPEGAGDTHEPHHHT